MLERLAKVFGGDLAPLSPSSLQLFPFARENLGEPLDHGGD